MSALGWSLTRRGYNVVNVGYPSRCAPLAEHAERLRRLLLERLPTPPLNFVTHSLGGIVLRLFAHRYHAEFQLHRAVMLGPPNNGAALARELYRRAPIVGRIMGPSFTEVAELDLPLATEKLEVGVIAGTLGPRTRLLPFVSPPNDGIVAVDETVLRGCRDAVIVPGLHSLLMYQPRIQRLVATFLESGRF
jgi:triacylglycerol lipase